jgi:hypothetical protein
MADNRDLPKSPADIPVRLPRPVRWFLGLVVLSGAALFLFIAFGVLFLFETQWSPLGVVMVLISLLFGFGMGYMGVRLLAMREHGDHLMSSRGARIASYVVGAVSVLTLVGSAYFSTLEYAFAAVFVALMAYWLHSYASRMAHGGQSRVPAPGGTDEQPPPTVHHDVKRFLTESD